MCKKSDGSDKRIPIIIGKSAKPRCFKNIKKIPVTYSANLKAWMMPEIFRDFLHVCDASFSALGRKILLFVDSCAVHFPDTSSLRKVKVGFYPLSCTSVAQPLDFSLIKCFIQVHRKLLV
jgi:hypothetical protein